MKDQLLNLINEIKERINRHTREQDEYHPWEDEYGELCSQIRELDFVLTKLEEIIKL